MFVYCNVLSHIPLSEQKSDNGASIDLRVSRKKKKENDEHIEEKITMSRMTR